MYKPVFFLLLAQESVAVRHDGVKGFFAGFGPEPAGIDFLGARLKLFGVLFSPAKLCEGGVNALALLYLRYFGFYLSTSGVYLF